MDEHPLGVHQIKLGVQTGPRLGDGRRVGQHADGPLHVCQIVIRHDGGRLIVDGHFESGRTPVDEVYRPFRLDERIGYAHVLRRHVTPVQHAARHVLRIALDHLVGGPKTRVRDVVHGELFVMSLLGAYVTTGKCIRGYGTRLVWNSVKSTFNDPLNRNDAVTDDTICPIRRFRFEYDGRPMFKFHWHMSYIASLSTMNAQSVCVLWVANTELYGSTTAVNT